MSKKIFVYGALWSLGIFAAGSVAGYLVNEYTYISSDTGGVEVREGGSGFTNPLLECDIAGDSIMSRKEDFSADLQSYVTLLKQKQDISDVSVYFRDLNNGPVIGVNQSVAFSPASLLKLPIMMTYLSRSETDPSILDQKITYDKNADLLPDDQIIEPDQQIELHKTYTVRELIEHMIMYSDNQAMALLYDSIPVAEQIELYKLLGVDPAVVSDPQASLTVKQYSVFFRILFNASFLTRANSEWALKLLSRSTFNHGLRAGVPVTIPIAHKFGERKFTDSLQQFHDCGIVYYPKHPYLLCIMTRGNSSLALIQAIADTSKFVYDKVDAQYGN